MSFLRVGGVIAKGDAVWLVKDGGAGERRERTIDYGVKGSGDI